MERQRISQILILGLVVALTGCAYRWGKVERRLPGGGTQVSIPVFKNKTKEVKAEVYFTNALIREIEGAGVGQMVPRDRADIFIEGVIDSIDFRPESLVNSSDLDNLPEGSVLATNFRMIVKTHLKVFRVSDGQVLWRGSFTGESFFPASQVSVRGLNTVNSLYNHSAIQQNLVLLSRNMMNEAYDRMTENF